MWATLASGLSCAEQLRTSGGESLSGIVRDEHGAPLAGVEVQLDGARPATTGADGSYVLPLAPDHPPPFRLSVAHPGKVPVERSFWRSDWDFRLDGHDFVLRAPLPIAGRVVDDGGAPVPGVMLTAMRTDRTGQSPRSKPSDELGRFRIETASVGEFELVLELPSRTFAEFASSPTQRYTARGGELDVEVVLPRRKGESCALAVRVWVGPGREPAELLSALALPVDPALPEPSRRPDLIPGLARFAGLEPGRYELWVAATQGNAHGVVELETRGAELATELVVEAPGSLHGHVELGGLARPETLVVGARVKSATDFVPFEPEFQAPSRPSASAELAPDGSFEFDGLMPGEWRVRLWGEGLQAREVEVHVPAAGRAEAVLVAERAAVLELDLSAWPADVLAECEIRAPDGAVRLRRVLERPRDARPPCLTVAPGVLRWSVHGVRGSAMPQEGELELVAGEHHRLRVPYERAESRE